MWKSSETAVSTTTVSPKMTLNGSVRTAIIVAPAMTKMKMLSIKVSAQNKKGYKNLSCNTYIDVSEMTKIEIVCDWCGKALTPEEITKRASSDEELVLFFPNKPGSSKGDFWLCQNCFDAGRHEGYGGDEND
jgi:hypothetical protein